MKSTAPLGGTSSRVNSVLVPRIVLNVEFKVTRLISKTSPISKREFFVL